MRTEVSETLGKLKIIEATVPLTYKVIFALSEKYELLKKANGIYFKEDNLHEAITEVKSYKNHDEIEYNRRGNKVQFIANDKTKSDLLPHPFNKGVFNDFVGEVSVIRALNHEPFKNAYRNQDSQYNKLEYTLPPANIILVEIKTFEPDSKRKSITKASREKIDTFKRLIEEFNDTVSFDLAPGKEKVKTSKSKSSIISESGLKNAKEEMDKYIAQVVQDTLLNPEVDRLQPDILLFDKSITDVEYMNQITFGLHDTTEDYRALNTLFNELQNKLIYRSLFEFMHTQLNILYKSKIGERRMKSLVGYILETGGMNISLTELLTSSIPENIIISRDTPFLNFKRVKLKPLKDEEK